MHRRTAPDLSDPAPRAESSPCSAVQNGPGLSRFWLSFFLGFGLAAVTFLAYFPLLSCDFINLDDEEYVTENQHLQDGLTTSSIWWALTSYDCTNWHPLTWLSLLLDSEIFGVSKPGGFHLTNLLFHLANVLLLFHILRRMTGAVWRSAFVAALFALHPLHVESVAWVSERKDVLSTFFWMLTMWAYLWYVQRPGWARYALVVLAFALGLASKPMLVTLPFVLLLLDYWPLRRWPEPGSRTAPLGRLVVEKLPLLVLTVASCVVTIRAQSHAIVPLQTFPFHLRVPNVVRAYGDYLVKMAWPVDLVLFYTQPSKFVLLLAESIVTGILLAAITFGVLFARGRRYLAVGWFWYLGTLAPVIGLVQVGAQSMADRYTYIPLIGIFIAISWGCGDIAEAVKRGAFKVGLCVAGALVLVLCALLSWVQANYWHNSGSMWAHVLEVDEHNYAANDLMGLYYVATGAPEKALNYLARAVELNRGSAPYRFHLGMAAMMVGNVGLAQDQLSKAIQLQPKEAELHHQLALAYVLSPQPDLNRALKESQLAVHLGGSRAEVYALLAFIDAGLGRKEESTAHYEASLQRDPRWPELANGHALKLLKQGQSTAWNANSALFFASQACLATNGRRPDFLQTLAAAEAATGRKPEAIRTLRKALALLPGNENAERRRILQEQMNSYDESKP